MAAINIVKEDAIMIQSASIFGPCGFWSIPNASRIQKIV